MTEVKKQKIIYDPAFENRNYDFATAIKSLVPDARFSVSSDNLDSLNWAEDNESERPTNEAIETEVVRLKAEWIANEYKRNREEAYPSMGVQLDYIYHNGIDAWKADIVDPIKTAYPKPAE